MTDYKLQNKNNDLVKELQQSSNIFVNKTGYCSKCLRELGEDRVVDAEKNEFCSSDCRKEYYYENRRDWDNLFRESRRK